MENENLYKKETPKNINPSAYDIIKNVVNNIEPLDINDKKIKDDLITKIYRVIVKNHDSDYFLMCAPYLKYMTMFHNKTPLPGRDLATEIYNFLKDEINNESLGKLKDYGYRDESNALEIWLGDECYMIFSYQKGVVEV